MKPLSITATITILAILLSACAGLIPAQAFHLDGTSWVLTTYNDSRPIEGTQPTIQFEDGQVSGNASCNHYGGSYQIRGRRDQF